MAWVYKKEKKEIKKNIYKKEKAAVMKILVMAREKYSLSLASCQTRPVASRPVYLEPDFAYAF